MRVRAGLVVLVVCLATILSGCSGGNSKTQDQTKADGYVVAGRLIDDDLLPVAGGSVALARRQDNAPVAQTNSSENGAFSFGKVALGTYVITVQATGFHPFVRNIDVIEGLEAQLSAMTLGLTGMPVAKAFHRTIPKTLAIQYGFAYAVMGDFNQGCLQPGYTCNAISYPPNAVATFEALDPRHTPWAGAVFEEVWTSTSPVCAKAVQVDIYNPDAPGTQTPNQTNPHYWTNSPSSRWKTSSPIVMVIPRNVTDDPESVDAPWRVESNGGKMLVRGNWTVRNFPPGKGLTNLAADVNCFTDQTFDLYWTNFYLTPPPAGFTARE